MNAVFKKPPVLVIGIVEIASVLGLGVNQVAGLVKAPGFPAVKKGKRWMCVAGDLEEWAKKYLSEEP